MTIAEELGSTSPFTEEEEACRRTVRAFLDAELEPNYEKFIGNLEYDRQFWRKAGKAGILGATIPEQYGGAGMSELVAVVIAQEQGRSIGGATIGSALEADVATHVLMNAGTEEDRRRLAPLIMAGELPQAVGATEPEAGSDLTAMRTTAVRDGDEYVINGTKTFISNGNKAELIYVAAKTDPTKRGSGMSLFLVEGSPTGMTRSRMKPMGYPAYDLAEIHFSNVRLPADRLMLGEGRAMEILMATFALDRLQVAARALGEAELALRLARDYVKERTAFGQRIIDFQNTQFVLAEMKTDIEAGRAFLHESVRKYRVRHLGLQDAAMLKLWVPQMAGRVVDKAVQLFGGAGYMDEMPVSRLYTASRLHRIYAGTDELQKVAIARGLIED